MRLIIPKVIQAWAPVEPQETAICFLSEDGRMYNNMWDGTIMRNFGYDPDLMASFVSQGYWRELE